MTRRALKWMLLAPLMALLLVTGLLMAAAYSVLHTETGARWLFTQAAEAVPGTLLFGELEGNLGDGLVLKSADFQDDALKVTVQKVELSAAIKWFPVIIQVRRLVLDDTSVQQVGEDDAVTEPVDLEKLLSTLSLPVTVEIDDLQVNGFGLAGADGEPGLRVDSLTAQARIKDRIDLELLELATPQASLALRGGLGFSAPFPVNAVLETELAGPQEAGLVLEAALEGELDNYQLFTSALLNTVKQGLEQTAVDMHGSGDLAGFRIASLTVTQPWLELAASGDIQWADELLLGMKAEVSRMHPGAWLQQWPADETLVGEIGFTLSGAGMLSLSEVRVRTAKSGMRIHAGGLIDLVQGIAEGSISWQELAWPIGTATPDIVSRQGSMALTGKPADWQLNGSASLQARDLPEGELTLEAAGNEECARLSSLEGAVFGGQVSGQAEYCWSGEGVFSASLAADGLSTAPLLSGWPGTVSMHVETSGRSEPPEISIEIGQLNGIIRDHPVNAVGSVFLSGNELELDNFQITSGTSRLDLNGSTNDRQGLSFKAEIDALESLLPGSSGSIDAHGLVSFDRQQPRLRLGLAAEDLSFEEIHIGRLEIHNADQQDESTIADLVMEAEQIHFAGQALEQLGLELTFGQERQQMRIQAAQPGLGLSAGIRGAFESLENFGETDWSQLSSMRWKGELEQLQLSESERLDISLIRPAPLELSAAHMSISSACLTAGKSSSLCLDANRTGSGSFSAAMKLQDIPLALAQQFVATDMVFNQEINGELDWRLDPAGKPSGSVSLSVSPGDIRFPDDADALVKTGEGHVGFNLQQGQLTAGNFDLPLPGNGYIGLDLEISDISAAGDGALNGQAHVVLEDLGFLPYLVDGIDLAEGRFETDLELGGTIMRPSSRGTTTLANATIENHAFGLRLSDIQLSGQTRGAARADLKGSFRAHEGQGELFATIDVSDSQDPRIDISLTGDSLTLVDEEDLRVVAIPDIQLAWQRGTLELGGSLEIPSARIAPGFVPSSSVTESPDRLIVAGEIPGLAEEEEQSSAVAIKGDIDVILGGDVEVDLSLAVVQLGGEANFAWQDGPVPIANGGFTMVGQIEAYGQLLRITDGLIGWPGSLANNPQLNIQAERRIYGNSEIRRAGVFVTGTLRRLVVEPYTDPITNRERARTLLITGSDFNMEKGVGAVDIGTYIAPRLFVSYGIGVFEDENVISVRYDLGRNWGVKATSGQRGTGLDISYTIVR